MVNPVSNVAHATQAHAETVAKTTQQPKTTEAQSKVQPEPAQTEAFTVSLSSKAQKPASTNPYSSH